MSFLKKYNPSKEESFIHSIVIGALLGLIIWVVIQNIAASIASMSLGFALWSKFADSKRIDFMETKLNSSETELKNSRKLIHGEYALKKITYLRTMLSKSSVNKASIPYALYELENILNQMYRCCTIGEEKEAFKQKKGIAGNFKTQIEISSKNDDMKEKYNEFIEKLQEIQVYIEEL